MVTVSGFGAYNTFVWSPSTNIAGTISGGYTFNPTGTTTYSLTASQTSGSLCLSVLNITVTVKPEPPSISIIPTTSTICQGQVQILNAALASATSTIIYQETFNGPTNDWIIYNSSTGGTVVNSNWTLRSSPYNYSSANWLSTNFSSNDASQFYFSNSDAQGGPSSNRTMAYLESPVINLAGYTSASLSFWQYLRHIPGNRARIEASINGGTTWATVVSYSASQGTASNFINSTVSLNSLVGNAAVKLRFYYDATWDYGWAIDNVLITGALAVEVSWSPATGLYFDALATNPYISGTPSGSVYAKPTTTTTFTGSAVGANGCSTSGTSIITVIPTPITGVLSGNQSICANWSPSSLNLTGFSGGSIIRWEYANDATFTTGLTTIANTTTTLSPAQIGTYSGIRYFRVVLQNGTCPIVYSNSVSVSFFVTAWDGVSWSNGVPTATTKAIFNGNYSSTGDLQACSVEVLSGTIIFNSGHTLNVQNDVKVTGGSLIFQNNASLVQVNSLNNLGVAFSNTGNITYNRNSTPVRKFDYTYWSSPVSPQTMANFSPNSNLFFEFNPSIGNWAYANINLPMTIGKGYLIRTPDVAPFNTTTPNVFSGSFVGVPNTGTITIPVVGGANQLNLLGNPYPSALSANALLSDPANVSILDATIYLWTHNTPMTNFNYTANDYAIYNYVGGVGTNALNSGINNSIPNGKIASGQGFFVKGLSTGNAVYKNSMRLVGNNNQFFRMSDPSSTTSTDDLERHRFWLDISNAQGAYKQLLVAYIENATNTGMDRGFDSQMVDVGNVINFYIPQEGINLAIQGRALPFNESDIIPIGYKSTIATSYTIKLSNFDGLFDNQSVYIEDTLLNVIHDLKASDYEFVTEVGTFDNRFRILFASNSLGVTTPNFGTSQVIIYKNPNNDFIVNTGATIMSNVKVFDIRGRLLLEQKEVNTTQTIVSGGLTNEVLLVQITSEDGVVVTKKVIR